MEADNAIRSAEAVLRQMAGDPEEVLAVLAPAERARLVEELGRISDRVAAVRSEAELAEVADAICRLVEDVPAMRPLFFAPQFDVDAAQARRKISLAEHEALTGTDQYTQARAIQVKNAVLECRDQLQEALGKAEPQARAEAEDADDHSQRTR